MMENENIVERLYRAGYDRFRVDGSAGGLCTVLLWKEGDRVSSIEVVNVEYNEALYVAYAIVRDLVSETADKIKYDRLTERVDEKVSALYMTDKEHWYQTIEKRRHLPVT